MISNIKSAGAVVVNKEILEEKFTCDLQKCKGACCTMESEYGAPIKEEEIEIITRYLNIIEEYIPQKAKNIISSESFYENKFGELMIRSINNRECVFAYYEGEIAKCGIEKAYFDGKLDFRKPISCHLFPIRAADFGGPILRYERYAECKPAVDLGKKTGITVAEFCKEALEREYGEEWYDKLMNKTEE